MAQPRKSDEKYPGYLADQDRKPFVPSAREEELLNRTVHPEEFRETVSEIKKSFHDIDHRLETLEVRFNELCNMLSVQLANSSFKLLEIREAKK